MQRMLEVIPVINTVWTSPLLISVTLYLLWNTIGPPILAGVAVMLILIPINGSLGNLGRIFQVSQMKNKDERVKLTTEVIGGMKVSIITCYYNDLGNVETTSKCVPFTGY